MEARPLSVPPDPVSSSDAAPAQAYDQDTTSTVAPSCNQHSASELVSASPELLEMTLLATTYPTQCRNGRFGHLFVWQRVNQHFANTIRDSSAFRKAMWLADDTPIADGNGNPFLSNPLLNCTYHYHWQFTDGLSFSLQVYGSGRANEQCIKIWTEDGIRLVTRVEQHTGRPIEKKLTQSWTEMRIFQEPCRVEVSIDCIDCDCGHTTLDLFWQFSAGVTYGDIAAAYSEALDVIDRAARTLRNNQGHTNDVSTASYLTCNPFPEGILRVSPVVLFDEITSVTQEDLKP